MPPLPPGPAPARPQPEHAARRLAFDTLTLVDEQGAHAREALAALVQRRPLPARDRDLATEIVQGVIRREDSLDAVLTLRLKRPIDRLDPRIHRVLRIGTYQILFLDRVPHAAAVATSVELARDVGRGGVTGLVNAVLRAVAGLVQEVRADDPDPRRTLPRGDGTFVVLSVPAFADPVAAPAAHLAARYSVSPWFAERLVAQRGADGARHVLEASISRPPVSLRPARGRAADVEAALTAAGVAFEREGACLLVRGAGDVRALPGWSAHDFVVQDATAADVAATLAPAEGAQVLDVCAAPGGKTIGLAEAVGPGGSVVAVDLPGPRVLSMMSELARRGIGNVDIRAGDAAQADTLPAGPGVASAVPGFDLVLVDAPCSNSGVLSKRVEARRRLAGPDPLASLVTLQRRLLTAAATRVRAGGRLAWSTCSVDDEENADLVREFLCRHADFQLTSERLTLPVAGRRDGGYLAVLTRGRG